MTRTTDLLIRNDLTELSLLRDALERFGAEHGLAQKCLVQLQVVLDELVSNVIKYGWPQGGRHEVSVRMAATKSEIAIEIVDDGRAFDPSGAARPNLPAPGKRPRPGGVGIHMVRQLVDAIEYARVDGYNHTKLTKRYAANRSPEGEHDGR